MNALYHSIVRLSIIILKKQQIFFIILIIFRKIRKYFGINRNIFVLSMY